MKFIQIDRIIIYNILWYIHVCRHSVMVVASMRYPAHREHTMCGFKSRMQMERGWKHNRSSIMIHIEIWVKFQDFWRTFSSPSSEAIKTTESMFCVYTDQSLCLRVLFWTSMSELVATCRDSLGCGRLSLSKVVQCTCSNLPVHMVGTKMAVALDDLRSELWM